MALLAAGYLLLQQGLRPPGLLPTLALIAVAQIVLLNSARLYPGYGIYPHECLRRRILTWGKVALLTIVGVMLFTTDWMLCALVLTFLVTALVLQLAFRAMIQSLLRRCGVWGMPAVIIAQGEDAEKFRRYFDENWRLGIRCAEAVEPLQAPAFGLALLAGAGPGDQEIDSILRRFEEVVVLAGVPGARAGGLLPGDVRGEIGLRLRSRKLGHAQSFVSRSLDVALALAALPVILPVMMLSAVAIYVVDPGPVLYRQIREGLGARHFHMLKLRTMYRDADRRLEALLAQDEEAQAEWSRHYKLRNDPRILPGIGNFLRMLSLDELPQVFNVLNGDMGIVGPRPFPLYHLDAMDPAFRARRCTVMPGITGLWQVSGRSSADIRRQEELDSFYIDNRSIWMDAQIILGTAAAVIKGDGAY
ncbi:sugar transferase [Paracoccus liaowanqingii]|nr:sugar transferase [Paracoccus liaowanqingii]